jgi:hypothetical protein
LSKTLNAENKKIVQITSPDEIPFTASDACIVLLKLEDIQNNFSFTDRLSEISKILETWDLTLKNVFEKIDDSTGVIFLSSIGDQNLTDL